MDVKQQIEAPINAYMRWETSDERVQQLLAYWIYKSRKPGKKEDPFRDWMLAERLLHSQSVLGVALAHIGMICPEVGNYRNALIEAIDATLKDWTEILGKVEPEEWSTSECAGQLLVRKRSGVRSEFPTRADLVRVPRELLPSGFGRKPSSGTGSRREEELAAV